MYEASFTMPVRPPFRLDLTVWVLRRRAKNLIDRWDGQRYTRVLVLENSPVLTTSYQDDNDVHVTLRSAQPLSASRQAKLESDLRNLLGLDVDLGPFYQLAADDPVLADLVEPFKGVRPPRFPSLFEALVNAIACQQVSLDVGILLLNRLTERFGKPAGADESSPRAFPEPGDLKDASEVSLRQLGFSQQKARSIHDVAGSFASDDVDVKGLETADNDQVITSLQPLRGIGRWSAEYALLRGLGRLDVFPGDDVGGQNNLQRLLRLDTRPGYEELGRLTTRWHPYAGLVYFHLLLSKLHEKALV